MEFVLLALAFLAVVCDAGMNFDEYGDMMGRANVKNVWLQCPDNDTLIGIESEKDYFFGALKPICQKQERNLCLEEIWFFDSIKADHIHDSIYCTDPRTYLKALFIGYTDDEGPVIGDMWGRCCRMIDDLIIQPNTDKKLYRSYPTRTYNAYAGGHEIRGDAAVKCNDLSVETEQYSGRLYQPQSGRHDLMRGVIFQSKFIRVPSAKKDEYWKGRLQNNIKATLNCTSPVLLKRDPPDQDGDKLDQDADKPDQEGDKPDQNADKPDQDGDKPDQDGDKPDQEGNSAPACM